MGKPRATEPYIQQKVNLPATLMARFAMIHWDPVLRKVKYGATSTVVTHLVTEYLRQVDAGEREPLDV